MVLGRNLFCEDAVKFFILNQSELRKDEIVRTLFTLSLLDLLLAGAKSTLICTAFAS